VVRQRSPWMVRLRGPWLAVTVAPFVAQVARAEPGARPGALADALAVFDGEGAGDRDGRVEWPDLDPDTLAAHLSEGNTGRLRAAFTSVETALGGACSRGVAAVTGDEVRCALHALAGAAPGLVQVERLGDEVGAVRTDSLRGIHDGADPPASEPWLWAHLVLNGLGVAPNERLQTGFEQGFPVDPDEVASWSPSYFSVGGELVGHLLRTPGVVDRGPRDARVSIRGRTSATLHEAVSTPAELEAEGFRSPGMLFLRGERLNPSTSLVDTGVRHVVRRMDAASAPRGGFFLVTFGANDLFSFRQILIGARQVEPCEFEADLRRLDQRTATLVGRGVRRIYVLPPPVDALFTGHVLPVGARFTDGSPVPAGSTALHQWWLAASDGRRLPRQDVLLPSELRALRERQDEFTRSAERVLGRASNWLVVDTRELFRLALARVASDGVLVDDVPGYGAVRYRGAPSVLSTDGVHPTRFGYLLWSEMVLEALRARGVALRHAPPLDPFMNRASGEALRAVLERAAGQIRRSPSFFRPSGFPFDPTHTEPLDSVLDDATVFEAGDLASCTAAYARTAFVWPFVPDAMLAEIAPEIDESLRGTRLLHHEVVGRLRGVLEASPAAWTRARRAAYGKLLRSFVEEGRLETTRHARLSRISLAAVGMPDDRLDRGFREGHTPGLFSGERVFRLGVEAVARADTRSRGASLWARAFVDDVPYRTPPSFLPLGLTDFMSLEGRVGVAATRPVSTADHDAAIHLEGWYTPLAFTSYADSLPDLAITLELPSWRPAFGMGDGCAAFSRRCTVLSRFSEGLEVAFWPLRDPAFRAGGWPEPALYAAVRGTYAFTRRESREGGASLEGSAGFAVGF